MKTKAIINIAKTQFGLADDDYRDVLERVTGKRSLRDMSEKERLAVVDDFKAKGFKVQRGNGRKGQRNYSRKPYVRFIHALWKSCAKLGVIDNGSKEALRSFVANRTKEQGVRVDDPEFLTFDQAEPIIEALKEMEWRGKEQSK